MLIGGSGDTKTLRIVAGHADIWQSFSNPATVEERRDLRFSARRGRYWLERCSAQESTERSIHATWHVLCWVQQPLQL